VHSFDGSEKKKNGSSLDNDTIVAVITPPGEGGIAALRIAGPRSRSILLQHFSPKSADKVEFAPFHMHYGYFRNKDGEVIDEIMAVYMPENHSYTGKDQVEIYCHGGRQVVKSIQDVITAESVRIAEPGEFTRLAFLAGRIDLTRAEAVAEIIAANTESSYSAAKSHLLGPYHEHIKNLRDMMIGVIAEVEASIDYPEDELDPADKAKLSNNITIVERSIKELAETYVSGRIINEGFRIVISGRPNAGKSSLFNLLLKQERALVTPTAGTTRDYLSEWIDLEGFKVNLIDTAGLRQTSGRIEKEGQKSARKIMETADLIVWMTDLTQKSWRKQLESDVQELNSERMLLLGNKLDCIRKSAKVEFPEANDHLSVSCKTGVGIDQLKKRLVHYINVGMPDLTSGVIVTSARHHQKLTASLKHLRAARKKITQGETPELTAFDLRQAVNCIDEITGKVYNEDILGRIFAKFCIGK
jgi:tRNA modification GTPase